MSKKGQDDELLVLLEDVADAWAAVLIDIYEKVKQDDSESPITE